MQITKLSDISSFHLENDRLYQKGDDPNTAWEKAKGQYGRVADAVKIIDPRKE